jgi:hypothetical protein
MSKINVVLTKCVVGKVTRNDEKHKIYIAVSPTNTRKRHRIFIVVDISRPGLLARHEYKVGEKITVTATINSVMKFVPKDRVRRMTHITIAARSIVFDDLLDDLLFDNPLDAFFQGRLSRQQLQTVNLLTGN